MGEIMAGEATPAQIGGFLAALRAKGETADEIAGCAEAMREHVVPVHPKRSDLVDTAGTGGDGGGTLNISTARRSWPRPRARASRSTGTAPSPRPRARPTCSRRSASGSSSSRTASRTSIDELGFGFMFAQLHHPAMRHAAPVRKELATRTVFNILGPLTNPAGARAQVDRRLRARARPHDRGGGRPARRRPRVRRARLRRHRRAVAGRAEPRLRGRRRRGGRPHGRRRRARPRPLRPGRAARRVAGRQRAHHPRRLRRRPRRAARRRSCSTPPARSRPPATPPTCARGSPSPPRRSTPAPPARASTTSRGSRMGRLKDALAGPGLAAIAEFKRRSPSAGDINAGADPARHAQAYARGGAAAMSVLVDERFAGSWDDLRAARAATELPLLAKGFFSTPEHLRTAREAGADAALLILRDLDDAHRRRADGHGRGARPRRARRGARRRRARPRRPPRRRPDRAERPRPRAPSPSTGARSSASSPGHRATIDRDRRERRPLARAGGRRRAGRRRRGARRDGADAVAATRRRSSATCSPARS